MDLSGFGERRAGFGDEEGFKFHRITHGFVEFEGISLGATGSNARVIVDDIENFFLRHVVI